MTDPKPLSRAFAQIEFLISASELHGCPQDDLPEVAFVGRSNVGKSSALNILANRKRLAFVSKTPGRTQLINFFSFGAGARLVDLPGYGYAKVPHGLRDEWGKLVSSYLQTRRALVGVVSLMDSRRPLTPLDHQLLEWLVPLDRKLLVLLTKSDKLTKSEQGRTLAQTRKDLASLGVLGECRMFSSQTRQGVEETRDHIDAWLASGAGGGNNPASPMEARGSE